MNYVYDRPETPIIYPVGILHIKQQFPNVALPATVTVGELAAIPDFFLQPVTVAAEPEFDPATERIQAQVPIKTGEAWAQGWDIIPLNEAELAALNPPRWQEFGAALTADAAVNAFVATLATAAPVLHLMIGVGLGQAAQGSPATFATAWTAAIPSLPEGLAAHVADLAGAYDLPAEFIAGLNP